MGSVMNYQFKKKKKVALIIQFVLFLLKQFLKLVCE